MYSKLMEKKFRQCEKIIQDKEKIRLFTVPGAYIPLKEIKRLKKAIRFNPELSENPKHELKFSNDYFAEHLGICIKTFIKIKKLLKKAQNFETVNKQDKLYECSIKFFYNFYFELRKEYGKGIFWKDGYVAVNQATQYLPKEYWRGTVNKD